ncbi:MAG: HepT-like ribonuclease domain-containing protein [Bacteroidota bacterium]
MDNDIKTWLYDILNSINEIESYYIETPKTFEIYQNDLRTKRAVERNIEIIGEAMSRILKADAEIKISNSRKIVDVRNRIIHGYDSVSDDVIWGIIIINLPVLQKEVEELLNE